MTKAPGVVCTLTLSEDKRPTKESLDDARRGLAAVWEGTEERVLIALARHRGENSGKLMLTVKLELNFRIK